MFRYDECLRRFTHNVHNCAHYAQLCPVMPSCAQLCPVAPNYVQLCPVMPSYVQLCPAVPNYAQLCPIMPSYVQLCSVVPNYAQLCPVMLSCAQLCPVVPNYTSYAQLCPVMRSCAQLCPVVPSYDQLCTTVNSNNRIERLNTCRSLCGLPVSVNRFYLKFSDTKSHVNPLKYLGMRYMRTETQKRRQTDRQLWIN